MRMLRSVLEQQIVRRYPHKQYNLDFALYSLRCHRDDQLRFTSSITGEEQPPFACSFNKSLLRGNMLAVADEDGGIYLFDLHKKCINSLLKGWVGHSNAIFDIAWVGSEPKLVTASGDQTLQLWDIQHSTRLAVFKGHTSSVKSVDIEEDRPSVFASGARDGNIMIWDVRCNKRDGYYCPVNIIRNCHSYTKPGTPQSTRKRKRVPIMQQVYDSQQSVTTVKYHDSNRLFSAGAVDGNIKVWDLRKNYSIRKSDAVPYYIYPYPEHGARRHGFSSLVFDSNKSTLFANCTNDNIYMFDCVSFKRTKPIRSLQGHSNPTFYVKSALSPDDQYLMSGSGDGDVYIWNINEPKMEPFHLVGHSAEVTSVAWCPNDQSKLVTCSDDNTMRVWRVKFEVHDTTDYIGWCEREIILNQEPDVNHDRVTPSETPNTSPAQSPSSTSSMSSPSCASPNPNRCRSPQQVLQTWLRSNIKQKAGDNPGMNDNDDENISDTSSDIGSLSERSNHNKENIDLRTNTQNDEEMQIERRAIIEPSLSGFKNNNTLADANKTPRKVASSPSTSEPNSPDKELAEIIKSMRCIKDYFKPVLKSDHISHKGQI